MRARILFGNLLFGLCLATDTFGGVKPEIVMGPADELAVDQPRVALQLVDTVTGENIGPEFAATFLLDTGANAILAVDDAVAELNGNGYRTEGVFYERGVAGIAEFDVSAAYQLQYIDSEAVTHAIDDVRILSSTEISFCPVPGACSFFGVAGMPLMEHRVTTMDFSSIVGGNIEDPFEGVNFMSSVFSDSVPTTSDRRYSLPTTPSKFEPEGDGPLPSWADIPFLHLDMAHGDTVVPGDYILDTGAQLSLISTDLAFSLGLDENGNGFLEDEAIRIQPIGGVGGEVDAPVLIVDQLRLPTEQGIELVYTDLSVAVVDIDPVIDGIFGMNLLTTGWLSSGAGETNEEDLLALKELLIDAGFPDLAAALCEEDGGGLLGGASHPYFNKAHLDQIDPENGRIFFDLNRQVSDIQLPPGVVNGDLDGDGDVDMTDRTIWVNEVEITWFGDANRDGVFDSTDLVMVFEAG